MACVSLMPAPTLYFVLTSRSWPVARATDFRNSKSVMSGMLSDSAQVSPRCISPPTVTTASMLAGEYTSVSFHPQYVPLPSRPVTPWLKKQ